MAMLKAGFLVSRRKGGVAIGYRRKDIGIRATTKGHALLTKRDIRYSRGGVIPMRGGTRRTRFPRILKCRSSPLVGMITSVRRVFGMAIIKRRGYRKLACGKAILAGSLGTALRGMFNSYKVDCRVQKGRVVLRWGGPLLSDRRELFYFSSGFLRFFLMGGGQVLLFLVSRLFGSI